MTNPTNLSYSPSHEWILEEGDITLIGLTHFAQSELGDIVFVNLPMEGDTLHAGDSFGDVESVKAVSDIISPVSGTVTEINEELLDNPALINEEPYSAWLVKVSGVTDHEELMDAAAYEAFCIAEKE